MSPRFPVSGTIGMEVEAVSHWEGPGSRRTGEELGAEGLQPGQEERSWRR